MRRLFYLLLSSLLLSLFLSLIVMVVTFRIGYVRSSRAWGDERGRLLEEDITGIIRDALTGDYGDAPLLLKERLDPLLPPGASLVVYDEKRRAIYTHVGGRSPMRGHGRGMMMHTDEQDRLPIKPVRVRGRTVGYYSLGSFGFGADRATSRFLESMRKTVFFSVVSAVVIALLFSLFVSRRLSSGAKTVSDGIKEMARGNLRVRIPERGTKEISRIAESANELAGKLEREENIRRQWAADIAHDLKTPITALRSQLEGMSDGVLDLSQERIGKNLKELSRIEALVSDLGELTRLESPRLQINPRKIDAGIFFGELNDRFHLQFHEKKIDVEWKKETEFFKGDEILIGRAMSNIISNAVRHTPVGGRITVGIRREEKSLLFTVFNTGRAIPKEELSKVFDRLYRGEYARITPGTGLGLTIAKKIAQLHEGDASISSEEGSGTTVEVRISE